MREQGPHGTQSRLEIHRLYGWELHLLVIQRGGVASPGLDNVPLRVSTDGDRSIAWRVLRMSHRTFLSR